MAWPNSQTGTILTLTCCLVYSQSLSAQTLQTVVSSGLRQPLYLTAPPGDENRLFIVEKGGAIKIFDRTSNTLLSDPYLTVPVTSADERGLLGLAFDPDFAANGHFYVNYTRVGTTPETGDVVVARYKANGDPLTSNVANGSGEILLEIEHSANTNHNGGWIGFRSSDPGRLYIAVGDGGPDAGNDPNNLAQNIQSPLGKILRIDVSGTQGYTIPSGNVAGGLPEVYQYGLRNPWRNSFDRVTGDFWIADVGQAASEELNFQSAQSAGGQNFGWRTKEGNGITNLNGVGPFSGLTDPILSYPRSWGSSITGGYVFRGDHPDWQGTYFFGDFISGRSWSLKYNGTCVQELVERTTQLDPDGPGPLNMRAQLASFGEDARGNLYMIALNRGAVYQIVVPEPSSVLLMTFGGLATLLSRRRGVPLRSAHHAPGVRRNVGRVCG